MEFASNWSRRSKGSRDGIHKGPISMNRTQDVRVTIRFIRKRERCRIVEQTSDSSPLVNAYSIRYL